MPKQKSSTPQPSEAVQKTFVTATDSIFGDFDDEGLMEDPARDRWFLPGYSEKRRAAELELRDRGKVQPLSHRFRGVSVRRVNGMEADDKYADAMSDGYVPVKWEEAQRYGLSLGNKEDGYTSMWRPDMDGHIINGSQMLMVCDRKQAAKNLARKRHADEMLELDIQARLDRSAEEANSRMGLTGKAGTAFEHTTEAS